jgi:hypothetical protein
MSREVLRADLARVYYLIKQIQQEASNKDFSVLPALVEINSLLNKHQKFFYTNIATLPNLEVRHFLQSNLEKILTVLIDVITELHHSPGLEESKNRFLNKPPKRDTKEDKSAEVDWSHVDLQRTGLINSALEPLKFFIGLALEQPVKEVSALEPSSYYNKLRRFMAALDHPTFSVNPMSKVADIKEKVASALNVKEKVRSAIKVQEAASKVRAEQAKAATAVTDEAKAEIATREAVTPEILEYRHSSSLAEEDIAQLNFDEVQAGARIKSLTQEIRDLERQLKEAGLAKKNILEGFQGEFVTRNILYDDKKDLFYLVRTSPVKEDYRAVKDKRKGAKLGTQFRRDLVVDKLELQACYEYMRLVSMEAGMVQQQNKLMAEVRKLEGLRSQGEFQELYRKLKCPCTLTEFMHHLNSNFSDEEKLEFEKKLYQKKFEIMFVYSTADRGYYGTPDFRITIRRPALRMPHPTLLEADKVEPTVNAAGTLELSWNAQKKNLGIFAVRLDSGHFRPGSSALAILESYLKQFNPQYIFDQVVLYTYTGDRRTLPLIFAVDEPDSLRFVKALQTFYQKSCELTLLKEGDLALFVLQIKELIEGVLSTERSAKGYMSNMGKLCIFRVLMDGVASERLNPEQEKQKDFILDLIEIELRNNNRELAAEKTAGQQLLHGASSAAAPIGDKRKPKSALSLLSVLGKKAEAKQELTAWPGVKEEGSNPTPSLATLKIVKIKEGEEKKERAALPPAQFYKERR